MAFNFMWSRQTHKGLRAWILLIVKDHPRTGVEIMNVMESSVQGWWRPSPGSIYPLLESMTEEGLLVKSDDKKYALTEKGREEVAQPFPWMSRDAPSARSPEEVIALMSSYVSYLEDLSNEKNPKILYNANKIRMLSERLSKLGESAP